MAEVARFKLGHEVDGQWRGYSHPSVLALHRFPDGKNKLVATAPASEPAVFLALVETLTGPLRILFVLHTTRTAEPEGRYESGELEHQVAVSLLHSVAEMLTTDSRFDLWVHSPSTQATIVWDRHDLIHVYGVVDAALALLKSLGFQQGKPSLNFPHQHHYHAENDAAVSRLLSSLEWRWGRLRPEDEQFKPAGG